MSRCVCNIDNNSVVIEQPGALENSWWQSLGFGLHFRRKEILEAVICDENMRRGDIGREDDLGIT